MPVGDDERQGRRPTWAGVLARECADAVARHRTLRRVIEHPYVPGDDATDEAMIRRYGLDGNHYHVFAGDEAYERQSGGLGGQTIFLRDPAGEDFSVVFLRHPPELDPANLAPINLGVLFHELGHVDDFERGLNLVPGRPVHVEESEYHANLYAFRQLYEGGYFLPLCYWFATFETSVAVCGVPAVEAAARRLIAADFYRRPRLLLGDVVRWVHEHLYG